MTTKTEQRKIAKKELKQKDKEWADAVKAKFNNECAYCHTKKNIQSAHIIPREIKEFRWELFNGISLCSKHHRFSFEFSAHQNPFAFFIWFRESCQNQYIELTEKWKEYIWKNEQEELKNKPKDY